MAHTLSEFRCASVRFHGALIRSMEEEKWKRDKERGKRKEKGTSRSITVKWGGVYRIRMRGKKRSKCTNNHPTQVPFDDRKGFRGARIVGRDMVRAASLGKRFRRKHKHTGQRTSLSRSWRDENGNAAHAVVKA